MLSGPENLGGTLAEGHIYNRNWQSDPTNIWTKKEKNNKNKTRTGELPTSKQDFLGWSTYAFHLYICSEIGLTAETRHCVFHSVFSRKKGYRHAIDTKTSKIQVLAGYPLLPSIFDRVRTGRHAHSKLLTVLSAPCLAHWW